MVAPFVLPRNGIRTPPQENESFGSGSAQAFNRSKTNGVVAAHVRRNPYRGRGVPARWDIDGLIG